MTKEPNVVAVVLDDERAVRMAGDEVRSPSPSPVCTVAHMRLHIQLDDDLVDELDRRCGRRRRSAFVAELIRRALEDERRWDDIESALGGIDDAGHEWDDDPAGWVQAQRRTDARRSG